MVEREKLSKEGDISDGKNTMCKGPMIGGWFQNLDVCVARVQMINVWEQAREMSLHQKGLAYQASKFHL